MQGFAYSGGGRGIVRVDVSGDGGKSWTTATLKEGAEQSRGRAWAWTLWEAEVDVSTGEAELICKAVDEAHNTQPDSVQGIWNLRGINNNAWHRVRVQAQEDDDEDE